MTALTQATLENALIDVWSMVKGNCIALKPNRLIVPPVMYRTLMWRPALHKARGVRGRKQAMKRRAVSKLSILLRSRT